MGTGIVRIRRNGIVDPFQIRVPLFPLTKGEVSDALLAEKMKPHVIRVRESQLMQDLSESEIKFLKDVGIVPDSGVSARYKRLGLSVRQGDKLKHQLLDKELLQEHEKLMRTGRMKVLRLTDQGKRILQE